MNSFARSRLVQSEDVDALNHMNNVRYLEWVQDISGEHWHSLAPDGWERDYIWVVRSHAITYFHQAFAGDILEVETFVKAFRGPVSTRVVRFKKQGTEQLLAESTTDWVLIDRSSHRPVRIPVAFRELLSPNPD